MKASEAVTALIGSRGGAGRPVAERRRLLVEREHDLDVAAVEDGVEQRAAVAEERQPGLGARQAAGRRQAAGARVSTARRVGAARLAMGGRVMKCQPPCFGTCSKKYTFIAVIEHAPMEVGT
jgi:hypothetical protein